MIKIEADTHQRELREHNKDNFIYVPSINLYVAKKRTYFRKDWFETHKLLQENHEFMPTIPQFREFLKYLKDSNNLEYLTIYRHITDIKPSYRGEWLDAIFEIKENKIHINYAHKLDKNKKLIPQNSEILNQETLIEDKQINLEDWINSSSTEQGLPNKNVKKGKSYFYYPRTKKAVRFGANIAINYLSCGWDPYKGAGLGVRAVIEELD